MTAEERPRGLGRGLSALIGEESVPTRGEAAARAAHKLPIAFLRPNKLQPRKRFASEELNDLADSVREKGVLQPILVRPVQGAANAYEIVAGERRWRAAQMAQLHEVPVVIREMNDSESLEIAIIENVQREDLKGGQGSRKEPTPHRQHAASFDVAGIGPRLGSRWQPNSGSRQDVDRFAGP